MTNVVFGAGSRRTIAPVLLVCVLGLAGGVLSPAAAVAGPGQVVQGSLLPVPTAGPGQQLTVTAVDVSPRGVVAGTLHVTTTNPDGTQSVADLPQRWVRIPGAGWLRQGVALPEGATSGTVTGLTDRGEAAGTVTLGGVSRAARWSASGRSATLIGDAGSRVAAVGPNGPWGVFSGDGSPVVPGVAELVTRDGTRTPLSGTSELDAGYSRRVSSIGGPGLALVWVIDGIGRATTGRPVLWQDGATVRLPVIDAALLTPACVSPVRADGSVVASGYDTSAGVVSFVLIRHVGGAPGTDIVLNRAAAAGQPVASLSCGSTRLSDSLAGDGGVAGFISDAEGQRAAYWNAANVATVVPLAAGERSAAGVAVAGAGRMVIQAQGEDGTARLSLWQDGIRTQLPAPDGWTVTSVVELTDAGLLVANVRDAAGTVRPAVWQLALRGVDVAVKPIG